MKKEYIRPMTTAVVVVTDQLLGSESTLKVTVTEDEINPGVIESRGDRAGRSIWDDEEDEENLDSF